MVSARSNTSMLSSSAACCNDAPRITYSPPRYTSKRCSIRTALRLGATHGPGATLGTLPRLPALLTHLALKNEHTAALAPRHPCRMAKVKAESMPSCGAQEGGLKGEKLSTFAGRATDEVRPGDQLQDSESARPGNPADAARPRRRGDRISNVLCCGA